MLSKVQSFAEVASVNEVNEVFPLILTSNAAAPVILSVARLGTALSVTSPALPVTVKEVNLVCVLPNDKSCAVVLFSSLKSSTEAEERAGSLSLIKVMFTFSKSVAPE